MTSALSLMVFNALVLARYFLPNIYFKLLETNTGRSAARAEACGGHTACCGAITGYTAERSGAGHTAHACGARETTYACVTCVAPKTGVAGNSVTSETGITSETSVSGETSVASKTCITGETSVTRVAETYIACSSAYTSISGCAEVVVISDACVVVKTGSTGKVTGTSALHRCVSVITAGAHIAYRIVVEIASAHIAYRIVVEIAGAHIAHRIVVVVAAHACVATQAAVIPGSVKALREVS